MTKKQLIVGGGLCLLMSPFVLTGALAYFVFRYLEAGWVIMGIVMDEIQKLLEL